MSLPHSAWVVLQHKLGGSGRGSGPGAEEITFKPNTAPKTLRGHSGRSRLYVVLRDPHRLSTSKLWLISTIISCLLKEDDLHLFKCNSPMARPPDEHDRSAFIMSEQTCFTTIVHKQISPWKHTKRVYNEEESDKTRADAAVGTNGALRVFHHKLHPNEDKRNPIFITKVEQKAGNTKSFLSSSGVFMTNSRRRRRRNARRSFNLCEQTS